MNRTQTLFTTIYVVVTVTLAFWVYQNTLHGEFETLQTNGKARLSEAANRLRLQVDSFRALVNLLATQPAIIEAFSAGQPESIATNLTDFALTYGAGQIDLVDIQGKVLASSTSQNISDGASNELIRAALNERLGFEQAIMGDRRTIRLSRSVRSINGTDVAVIIVTINLTALEFEWPVVPEPVIFLDKGKQVFSSNRPSLLLLVQSENPKEAQLSLLPTGSAAGVKLWRFQSPDEATSEVIVLEQYVPHLELLGQLFLDTSSARATARLRLLLELALSVVLGLIGIMVLQGRRRLALVAQHSQELEKHVEARTKELKDAQNELVEASKLAALGRMSAGISHELNQPLATILNFSENSQKLLAKGRVEAVVENLETISKQISRINRIIGNLRAFARQDTTKTEKLDFRNVTEIALALMKDNIKDADTRLTLILPPDPVYIQAGRIRLEQVLVNIISNALDAMTNSLEKHLRIIMKADLKTVRLVIQDTGQGIAEPDRVFEPFYTSKELGSSNGLGMGLSLSFGIIARFDGQLACKNHDQGAEFEIVLPVMEANHG